MHGHDHSQAPDCGLATARQVGFAVRRVTLDSPWEWLAAGWRDLRAVPLISLGYGVVFTLVGWLLVTALNRLEMISLIPIFAGGFVLIAPLLAAGLYEVSRLLEKGQRVTVGAVLSGVVPATGRLGLFGVALFLGFFAWIEMAFLLLSLFLGERAVPDPTQFVHTLLFTNTGVALLFAGTICGGILAAMVFTLSSIAAPLLLAKDVDAVTAMATSVRAVGVNLAPMLLWAALIAGHMAIGLMTLFVGLVVVVPLLGYATWHAFRELVVIHRI